MVVENQLGGIIILPETPLLLGFLWLLGLWLVTRNV
jgi:hypothetical protein